MKRSWTRSPQPFAIRLRVSRAHTIGFGVFVSLNLLLILATPIGPWAKVLCALLITTFAAYEWRQLRRKPTVLSYSPNGTWRVYQGGNRFDGSLGKHSYRSRWLCIVAVESEMGDVHYVVVFYDAVDTRSYSLLQLMLKFP